MQSKKNSTSKKKGRGRPPKYDWDLIHEYLLLLAKVGITSITRAARVIDIPKTTLLQHLEKKESKDFMKKLQFENLKILKKNWESMQSQADAGYFPAIQFLLNRELDILDKAVLEDIDENKDLKIIFGVKKNAI